MKEMFCSQPLFRGRSHGLVRSRSSVLAWILTDAHRMTEEIILGLITRLGGFSIDKKARSSTLDSVPLPYVSRCKILSQFCNVLKNKLYFNFFSKYLASITYHPVYQCFSTFSWLRNPKCPQKNWRNLRCPQKNWQNPSFFKVKI